MHIPRSNVRIALSIAWSCFALFVAASDPLLAQTNLVPPTAAWRYRKGLSAPATDWKTALESNLDSTWLVGNGGFGYADNATETQPCQTLLADMKGNYTTLAMRTAFEVSVPLDPAVHLQLMVDYDDGFIAWLDGVYLASANSPGAPAEPAFNAVASASHESSHGSSGNAAAAFDLGPVGSRLTAGAHVLGIIGLNQGAASSDFIQVATLSLSPPPASNCLSGLLTADTILAATNSPHLVCGNLTIASGVTLTIEPGVTVQVASGYSIAVANGGRIVAEGTEDARIRFTSAQPGGSWSGLTINGAEGSPETRLAYADFDGNSSVCIEVSGGTLYLDHATFGTTTHQYVSLDDSSFLISHCHFPSSTAPFELLHGTGGIKNGGRGIVRDCYFGSTSGYNDIMDFTGGNRPNQPIIQYYNNVFTGATDDILDLDGTDAWIEGNIFLHTHKNGAPDSSAAISGGNSGSATSDITIVRNLFFDCDQAATAKQGNFYTLINNTIVLMTRAGGLDNAAGVVNMRDVVPSPPTAYGAGCYLEGNVVVQAEQLAREFDPEQMQVTWVNNLLPALWTGPGVSNLVADPMLKRIPTLSETQFTNWTSAQVLWDWFSLQPGSPAAGAGPQGRDLGAVVPPGVTLSGEPQTATDQTSATLTVGFNRSGSGIPSSSWTNGAGYVAYKWRLDAGDWSPEQPLSSPIVLTNLAPGGHQVAVIGKNDAGFYQNDPALGTNAVVSLSLPWTVQPNSVPGFTSVTLIGNQLQLRVSGGPATTYYLETNDRIEVGAWTKAQPFSTDASGNASLSRPIESASHRFYRLTLQP